MKREREREGGKEGRREEEEGRRVCVNSYKPHSDENVI